MARIYKPVKGKGRKWYIDYVDGLGIRRRVAGFRDKPATEQRAAELVRRADREASGLVDRFEQHRKRPLTAHVDDYQRHLADKASPHHVATVIPRVRKVLAGCRFTYWPDVSASKVQEYIGDRKRDGLGAQTCNDYGQAIRQFCRWMVQDGRAPDSPVQHLKGGNVRTDRRHDRRALSDDELRRLLDTTRKSVTRFGMTGGDRATLYTLAVETGLRRNELRTLVWGACDLDGDSPSVTVKASFAKSGREDVQPLKPSTAQMLGRWRDERGPVDRLHSVFPSMPEKTAAMIRADLAEAGIEYRDESGRVADFHALRHTFVSALARGGVHPKIAQALARHSTITLTMDRYSHTVRGDLADGLNALPALDRTDPTEERQRATGTCDNRSKARATGSAKYVPNASHRKSNPLHPVALSGENGADVAQRGNATKQGTKCTPLHVYAPPCTDEKEQRATRLELVTFSLEG
ncbi:MAG: tyrosine-type recombinase/integrase [Planctomycetes bacterium]|nr:tyrosine-type recombinase/integrase [Planctomycetota bacterium]